MTALPPSTDFTGSSVTQAGFKTAITALHDYLSGLFGTDGTAATALTTVGAILNGIKTEGAAYTVVAADKGKLIDCTTGTWSLSLTAVATLGAGFTFAVKNSGTGIITIDPNGSETIDGVLTIALNAGESCAVLCDGTQWKTFAHATSVNGAFRSVQVFTTSGTYTAPSGLVRAKVTVVGGGGGGQPGTDGGFGNPPGPGGAGGSAGGTAVAILTAAQIGASQTVTIGAAGASGSAGGTSSFGALVSASGGAASGGAPGAGSGGNINASGGKGMPSSGAGGSAGSAGGVSSYISFGSGGFGGAGCASGSGCGPASSGAAGIVIVEEFY